MKSRIENLPAYEIKQSAIDTRYFNRVRVTLSRCHGPLRFDLPGLRDLSVFLDEDLWVCFDHSQNDMPVIAWTDFNGAGRTSLHEEIPCTLRLYHNHAEIIIDKVLATVYDLLGKELDRNGLPRNSGITSLEIHRQKKTQEDEE